MSEGRAAVSLDDQISCVERELAMRRNFYAKRVREGRMHQATAAIELQRMEAVLETLKRIAHGDFVPAPGGDHG